RGLNFSTRSDSTRGGGIPSQFTSGKGGEGSNERGECVSRSPNTQFATGLSKCQSKNPNDYRQTSRRQGIRGVGIAELPVASFAHEVSDSPIARSHKACPPNLRMTLRTLYRQLRMSSQHSLFCLP